MAGTLARIAPAKGESNPQRWIGRIAIFEMVTGTRVQGKILAISDDWIDTDNGAVKVEHIVHARWVGIEEASITRAVEPLNTSPYDRRLR